MMMLRCGRVSSRYYQTSAIRARGPLRFDGWYPRDHQPGPYPITPEEHRRAAMKYGLRPEDYKPIDRDNVAEFAGDYPDLGIPITFDHKDPYENYSYRGYRRNWAEAVQMRSQNYRPDRYTFTNLDDEKQHPYFLLRLFGMAFVPLAVIVYYCANGNPNTLRYVYPAMPKQYSYDYHRAQPWNDPRLFPIVNYSFDPVDE